MSDKYLEGYFPKKSPAVIAWLSKRTDSELPWGTRADSSFQQQDHDSEPMETLYCKICGGLGFNVGQGGYETRIRCLECLWEYWVHDG